VKINFLKCELPSFKIVALAIFRDGGSNKLKVKT
jgi:hypothetical protein